jgi:chloride channel protein, CIC family
VEEDEMAELRRKAHLSLPRPSRIAAAAWSRWRQSIDRRGPPGGAGELGDFTTGPRTIPIALIAAAIGALALLRLIGLFTNLPFFRRWGLDLASPAGNHLGGVEVLVPVGGAPVIGLVARYGSERIRGHGIPEAMEAILITGSRVRRPLFGSMTSASRTPLRS